MVAVMKASGAPTQAEFHAVITDRADRWYAVCLRITRDPAMAEDAVQDALLSAWNKRDQYERSARLDTWIHRIAVNSALQLLRKYKPAAQAIVVNKPLVENLGFLPVFISRKQPVPYVFLVSPFKKQA